MRLFIITLALLIMFPGISAADSFFLNNNPFPNQIYQQNLNNIYEITPEAIEREKKTIQKTEKSRWWKVKNNNSDDNNIESPSEGILENNGFILLK